MKRHPRDGRLVFAADEREAARGVALDELEDIVRVDAAAAGRHLPRLARVVLVLVLLHPDARAWKEIDAAGVIPVHVRQEDVRHIRRPDPERRDRLGRRDEILHRELREVAIAVKPGIDERDAAVGAFQRPDRHRDVEAARAIGAGDQACDRETGDRGEPDGIDLVLVGLASQRRGKQRHSNRERRENPPALPSPPCEPDLPHPYPPCRPSSRSARRSTLPTIVFGSSVRNSIFAGTLYGARCSRQNARSSGSVAFWPSRRTTHALTASIRSGSGTPATPTSRTAGCVASTSSTSRGQT